MWLLFDARRSNRSHIAVASQLHRVAVVTTAWNRRRDRETLRSTLCVWDFHDRMIFICGYSAEQAKPMAWATSDVAAVFTICFVLYQRRSCDWRPSSSASTGQSSALDRCSSATLSHARPCRCRLSSCYALRRLHREIDNCLIGFALCLLWRSGG